MLTIQQILGILGYGALCLSGKQHVMYLIGNPLPGLLMSVSGLRLHGERNGGERATSLGKTSIGDSVFLGVCLVPAWFFVSLFLIDILSVSTGASHMFLGCYGNHCSGM